MSNALGQLLDAAKTTQHVAARLRANGGKIVWTLGWDIPRELIDAFGLHPIRLVPGDADDTAIRALVGAETLGSRGLALLAEIARLPAEDAVLISHADADQPQLFATLRELARCSVVSLPAIHFIDLLTIDRPATRTYNRLRVEQTIGWLGTFSGSEPDFATAISRGNIAKIATLDLFSLRASGHLSGGEAHHCIAASAIIPLDELCPLLASAKTELASRTARTGPRVLLSGTEIEHIAVIDAIEVDGATVFAEDHGWGANRLRLLDETGEPVDVFAASTLEPTAGPFARAEVRSDALAIRVSETAPDRVVHLRFAGNDGVAWEAAAMHRASGGTPFLTLCVPDNVSQIAQFLTSGTVPELPKPQPASPNPGTQQPPRETRSRKSLAVLSRFGKYQREWFAQVRADASAGNPFVVVNANSPQEMLRALGVPFVVNQWWASISAAKQQGERYAGLLTDQDLPANAEAYSSQGVAAAFDHDAERAPWGGLPRPSLLGCVLNTDATAKLFETWAQVTGAKLQQFQRSVESRWEIPIDWWNGLADDWDTIIEPERLDLFEAELRLSIAELEELTGVPFDNTRFAAIMDLVNEQEEYSRRTRDLVAATVPAPISIVDQMPATMVPQWHRGTEWGRDAARDFYEEVAARAAAGEAACPGERIRLMFVGRGVWGDMGFYQRWEESHGAVMVCSMYLSLAADGYIRHHDRGRDPLRALAARFVTMGDELRMPTWAGAWHVKEARLHGVDGAIALSDADPLVLRALREAGVAVLELGMDNYVRDEAAEADVDQRVVAFLEGPAAAASEKRRALG